MDIELVVKSVVGLIVLLTLLVIIFILPARAKKKKKVHANKDVAKTPKKAREQVLTFDELRAIVRRRNATTQELEKAVEQIVKHYSKIHPKMGLRTHPEFDKYIDLIVHLVRHKNTNKDLILKLDRALTKKNPNYKAELNDALTKALNSRG